MPAETAPEPRTRDDISPDAAIAPEAVVAAETGTPAAPPEQVGFNPSDFRTPLAYEADSGAGSPPETPIAPEAEIPQVPPEVVVPLGPEAITSPASPDSATPEAEPPAPEPGPSPVEPPPGGEVSPPPPAGAEVPPPPPARRRGRGDPPFGEEPDRARSRLERLRDRVYETAFRDPAARLEMRFDQWRADRSQEAITDLSRRLDGHNARIEVADEMITELEADIADMRANGEPGMVRFETRLQARRRDRSRLLEQRDIVQTELEAVVNNRNSWTGRRNGIADRLIRAYDAELQPLEDHLERLNSDRAQLELDEAISRANETEQQARLEELQRQSSVHAQRLRAAGDSDREIRRAVDEGFNGRIAEIQDSIRRNRQILDDRRQEIDDAIEFAQRDAAPVRDRRETFVHARNDMPPEITIPARTREAVSTARTPTADFPRTEVPAPGGPGGGGGAEATATRPEAPADTRPTIAEYISRLNTELARTIGGEDRPQINQGEFFERVRARRLRPDQRLDVANARDILRSYLRAQGVPVELIGDALDRLK